MTKASAARKTKTISKKTAVEQPNAAAANPALTAEMVLNNQCYVILNNAVRGIAATMPVNAELLVVTLAGALGRVLGEAYGGEVNAVTRARDLCRAKFSEQMLGCLITPIPTGPQAVPQTPQ